MKLTKIIEEGLLKCASEVGTALQAGREMYPNVARGVTAGGLVDTPNFGTVRPWAYRAGENLSPMWKRHELTHWMRAKNLGEVLPTLKEEAIAGFNSGKKYNMAGKVAPSSIRGATEAAYQAARHPHYLGNSWKAKLLGSSPVQTAATGIRHAGNVAGNIHAAARPHAKQVASSAATGYGAAKAMGAAAIPAAKSYAAAAAVPAAKFVAAPAAAAAAGYAGGRAIDHGSRHVMPQGKSISEWWGDRMGDWWSRQKGYK